MEGRIKSRNIKESRPGIKKEGGKEIRNEGKCKSREKG